MTKVIGDVLVIGLDIIVEKVTDGVCNVSMIKVLKNLKANNILFINQKLPKVYFLFSI